MTHYYTTEDIPGHTYTNVACGTSDLFGQLFPYPPELMPTTSAQPTNSTTLSSDTDSTESESRPVLTGAIVGAIVAAIILVIFLITATVCFARRKRSHAHLNTSAAKAAAHRGDGNKEGGVKPMDALPAVVPSGGGNEAAEVERKRRLRLSTIPEVLSPTSPTGTGNMSRKFNKSKSARRSYGPDWPLGSAGPLESHPMPLPPPPPPPPLAQNTPDPEKPGEEETPQTPRRSIPTLNLFAASPTAKSHKRTSSASQPVSHADDNLKVSPITPDSARVMLQSPRLSYHPVSPMDAAFNDEVERRVSRLEGPGPSEENENRSGEVSPIDDDDDVVDARHPLDNRLSLISVPTVSEDGARLDDIVSPVSPQEEEHEEKAAGEDVEKKDDEVEEAGDVSPMSVSPIESRRSSLRK